MHLTKRLYILLALVVLSLGIVFPARAQEPTAIIDRAFGDLSQRLGRTITKATLGSTENWSWEGVVFPDASLGCPAPGQTYAAVTTRGFKILILVGGSNYDYRAN